LGFHNSGLTAVYSPDGNVISGCWPVSLRKTCGLTYGTTLAGNVVQKEMAGMRRQVVTKIDIIIWG